MTIESYISLQRNLVELEACEEIEETKELLEKSSNIDLQMKGVSILKLSISSISSGLYGRTLVCLTKGFNGKAPIPLPSTKLSSGDIVGLFTAHKPIQGGNPLVSGVIHKVRQFEVVIALEETEGVEIRSHDSETFHIAIVGTEITKKRQLQALSNLEKAANDRNSVPCANLLDTLFPPLSQSGSINFPRFCPDEKDSAVEEDQNLDPNSETDGPIEATKGQRFVTSLNLPQRRAVRRALAAQDVSLILGPPGTGKTTTVAEIILQEVRRGTKVLATAPSNVAVDNLMEKVLKLGVKKVVRIGHPSRTDESMSNFALDYLTTQSDSGKQLVVARRELDAWWKPGGGSRTTGGNANEGLKALRAAIRKYETECIAEVLENADVVFSTCTGADDSSLRRFARREKNVGRGNETLFGLTIIDEAAQCLEVLSWVPALMSPRLLLAGDDKQLPPTVKSAEAVRLGMSITLFERLHAQKEVGAVITSMLEVQYRMHAHIMQWSSETFYDGKLKAHADVATATLQMPYQDGTQTLGGYGEDVMQPLRWIDSEGIECMLEDDLEALADKEKQDDSAKERSAMRALKKGSSSSRSNLGEAMMVRTYVSMLVNVWKVDPASIAVISPYNRQVEILKGVMEGLADQENWKSIPVVATIDSFQGRERDVVVLSLVRSNRYGETGFLSDHRRLNVAVTRARRHCCIIADSKTVSHDKVLVKLFNICCEFDAVDPVSMYIDESDIPHRPVRTGGTANAKAVKVVKEKREQHPVNLNPPLSSNATALKKLLHKTASETPVSSDKVGNIPSPISEEPTGLDGLILGAFGDETRRLLSKLVASRTFASHTFPDNLNSFERRAIHEISDALKLKHFSQDLPNGKRALIVENHMKKEETTLQNIPVLQKEKQFQQQQQQQQQQKEQAKKEVKPNDVSPSPIVEQKFDSEAELTSSDDEEKVKLDKTTLNKSTTSPTAPVAKPKQKQKAKSKSVNLPKMKEGQQEVDDDDFDDYLNNLSIKNKSCPIKGCRGNVELLGRQCRHCTQIFCGGHIIPEAHGCGDAASKFAKASFSKNALGEGLLIENGVINNKSFGKGKSAEWKRQYAVNQLEKKIDEAKAKRTAAVPKAKKK